MQPIRRIVIVADTGEEQPALRRGWAIATAAAAEVELIAFVYDGAVGEGTQLGLRDRRRLAARLMAERRHLLERAIGHLDPDARKISLSVVWAKRFAVWLCANIGAPRADLVVKSSHPSARPYYLPSDWYLMRELGVPLLLVNPEAAAARGGVCATLNAGGRSRQARALDRAVLAAAGRWANAFGGPMHAVYVREVPPLPLDLGLVERRAYLHRQEKLAAELLAARLRGKPRGIAVSGRHAVLGRPEHTLPAVVRRLRVGVTVVGTAARKGLQRWILGSTAEQLIPRLATDVLIVRPRAGR